MLRFTLFALALGLMAGPGPAADDASPVDLSKFKWKGKPEENGGYDDNEGRFFMYSNGGAAGEVTVPEDGEYTLTIEASCTEAQKELAKFKVTAGGTMVAKEHTCTAEERKPYKFTTKLKKGKQELAIEFLNDKYKENEYDLNLFIHAIKVEKK